MLSRRPIMFGNSFIFTKEKNIQVFNRNSLFFVFIKRDFLKQYHLRQRDNLQLMIIFRNIAIHERNRNTVLSERSNTSLSNGKTFKNIFYHFQSITFISLFQTTGSKVLIHALLPSSIGSIKPCENIMRKY